MKRFVVSSIVGLTALFALGSVTLAQDATPTAPNNSAVNVRDRGSGAVTSGEQSNAKSDLELTRQIRRSVERDSHLSMQAHNVKIISEDGVVTLRGPVKTRHEKVIIGEKAREIAGANHVNNLIQIETR